MITKLKNRYGIADQVIPMAFYGTIGWFKEIPKAEEISDHQIYYLPQDNITITSLNKNDVQKDEAQKEPKKEIIYSF